MKSSANNITLLKSDFQNFLLLIILTLTFLEIFVSCSCVRLEVVPVTRGVRLLCTVIRVVCTWVCSNCYKADCFSNFKSFLNCTLILAFFICIPKPPCYAKLKDVSADYLCKHVFYYFLLSRLFVLSICKLVEICLLHVQNNFVTIKT